MSRTNNNKLPRHKNNRGNIYGICPCRQCCALRKRQRGKNSEVQRMKKKIRVSLKRGLDINERGVYIA